MNTAHLLGFSLLLGLAATGSAAPVSWSSQHVLHNASSDTDATWYSDLSVDGTLVLAENSGGGAIDIDLDNNGVVDIPFSAGSFTLGGTAGAMYNTAASNSLLDDATWSSSPGDLGLSVTPGQDYVVQLLFSDVRSYFAGIPRSISVDGGAPEVYQYTASPYGYRLFTGTFTADTSTQSISLAVFDVNGTPGGSQLNAFQLRAVPAPVPEPGAAGLCLLGSIGLLYSRRRA